MKNKFFILNIKFRLIIFIFFACLNIYGENPKRLDINFLAPKPYNNSLELALKELEIWKKENSQVLSEILPGKLKQTYLHFESKKIFNKWKIFEFNIFERIKFAEKIFEAPHPNAATILSILEKYKTWIKANPQYFIDDRILPIGYLKTDEIFEEIREENETMLPSLAIDISVALDWIVFNFEKGEKQLLELLALNSELQNEKTLKGSGNLPTVIAISDIHGGVKRLLPIVGHLLGLPDDIQIKTTLELKEALEKYKIKTNKNNIRIVGLSDIPDRGAYPVESHRAVKYIVDELGIGRFILGNHDLWRLLGVLGVDLLPMFKRLFKDGKYIGPSELKGEHPAFWAWEAVFHSGWSSVEIDELNQARINAIIESINHDHNLEAYDILEEIDIIKFRYETLEPDIKKIKNQNNEFRMRGELDKIVSPPNVLEKTIAFLNEEISKINQKIKNLNKNGKNIKTIDFTPLNIQNYRADPEVLKWAYWIGTHFRLYYIDNYGNIHWHSIVPIDEIDKDGKTSYELGVIYKERKGLKALEAIQSDIRTFFSKYSENDFIEILSNPKSRENFRLYMWNEIGGALTVVNSWYSDISQTAKPNAIKMFLKNGGHLAVDDFFTTPESFNHRQIFGGMFTGHNEVTKYRKENMDWIEFLDDNFSHVVVQTDGSMSEGYDFQGRAIVIGRMPDNSFKGIKSFGFENKNSTSVTDMTLMHLYSNDQKNKNMLIQINEGDNALDNTLINFSSIIESLLLKLIQKAILSNEQQKISFYKKLAIKFGINIFLKEENITLAPKTVKEAA